MLHKGNKPLLLVKNGLLQLLGYIITNKLAVNSTMDTSLKNKIFVDVFLVENMSMLL